MSDPSTVVPAPELARLDAPFDWTAIDATVTADGGAIVKGLLDHDNVVALNDEIDGCLAADGEVGRSQTGSDGYDLFLGHRTIRLHGLAEKLPSGAALGKGQQ